MEQNETRAFYRAIADFSAVKRELKSYRKELAQTKAAEEAYNASSGSDSAAGSKKNASALRNQADATREATVAARALSRIQSVLKRNVDSATGAIIRQSSVLKANEARLRATTRAAEAYAAAQGKKTGTVQDRSYLDALRAEAGALDDSTRSRSRYIREIREEAQTSSRTRTSSVRFSGETKTAARAVDTLTNSLIRATTTKSKYSRATDDARSSTARFRRDADSLSPTLRRAEAGTNTLLSGFRKLSNWRPRLTPPFVALIPAIGGAVSALGPLLSMVGAVGAAIGGLAANVGSLAGTFLALPGILSGVVAGLGSVIASFGGIGSVFKAYGAMNKAVNSSAGGSSGTSTGGGTNGSLSSGATAEQRAYDQARAEYNLAKAHKTVQKAQENLNKARQEALEDLQELRQEVSRAGLNEERAVANLQQAKEALWRVLADPGSTKGDKMDAAADLKEAEQDLADVRKQSKKNAADLTKAEKAGVEGSEKVKDAKEDLTDAIWSERDAQRALKKQLEDTGSTTQDLGTTAIPAAVSATNDFNDALAKLSPSAQKFVWAIIGMKAQYEAFRHSLQEAFFSQFVDSLDRLPQALKNVQAFLQPAAVSMGRFVDSALRLFTSSAWNRDIATIGQQNGTVLDAMGRAALALAGALKDITIAAGPFTDFLVNGLADGAENFERIVAAARNDGSLANWLDTVAKRLEKWVSVIGDIATAVYNYGSILNEVLGDWMLDGAVEGAENIKKKSDSATSPNSEFRQYLENLKPLLSEIGGLFNDVFGWLKKQMMDPKNIEGARNLVRILREDLAPAIGRLVDTLNEANLDEKLLEDITVIVDGINELIEAGGDEVLIGFLEGFASALQVVFDTVSAILGVVPDGGKKLFGEILGFLLPFVTGLSAVNVALKGFKWLFGLGKGGKGGKGGFLGGLFGGKDGKGGKGGLLGGLLGDGSAKGGAKLGLKALGKAGPLFIASLAADLGASWVNNNTGDTTGGAWARIGADTGAGAVAGASIGSYLGPWGAAIGGVLGAGYGAVTGGKEGDWSKIGDSIANVFRPVGTFISDKWDQWVVQPFKTVSETISNWWNEKVVLPFQTASNLISTWWNEEVVQPFARLSATIKEIWDLRVVQPFNRAVEEIKRLWDLYVTQPFNRAVTEIKILWTTYVAEPFRRVVDEVKRLWNNYVVTPFKNAVDEIKRLWRTYVADPFRAVVHEVKRLWNDYVVDPFKEVSSEIKRLWNTWVVDPFKTVIDGIKTAWEDKIVAPFKAAADAFKNFNLIDAANDAIRNLFGLDPAGGGKERRGGVGDVPYRGGGSTLSRVQKLLPGSGLGITSTYRSPAQNRAVGGSSTSLHMDRNNPAVDVAGSSAAMYRFATMLAAVGGWRQLYYNPAAGRVPGVGYWPGHDDHVHVANKGGMVPGHGNGDGKKPFRLTPGEFVLRKEVVRAVGAENISRLNSGVATWQDMLLSGAQRSLEGQSSSISTGGAQGLQNLVSGQGLQGSLPRVGSLKGLSVSNVGGTTNNRSDDYSVNLSGDLHFHSVLPEKPSEFMPNAVRKLGYMNMARSPK